jgi:hypothetical protein
LEFVAPDTQLWPLAWTLARGSPGITTLAVEKKAMFTNPSIRQRLNEGW